MFILSIFRLIMYRNLKENLQAIYYHKEEGLIEHTASSFFNLTNEVFGVLFNEGLDHKTN